MWPGVGDRPGREHPPVVRPAAIRPQEPGRRWRLCLGRSLPSHPHGICSGWSQGPSATGPAGWCSCWGLLASEGSPGSSRPAQEQRQRKNLAGESQVSRQAGMYWEGMGGGKRMRLVPRSDEACQDGHLVSPLGMTRFTCEVSRRTSGRLLSLPAHFKDDTPEERGSGVGLGQRPRAGDLGVGVQAGGCPEALLARACQLAASKGGHLGLCGPADGLRTGHSSENTGPWAHDWLLGC